MCYEPGGNGSFENETNRNNSSAPSGSASCNNCDTCADNKNSGRTPSSGTSSGKCPCKPGSKCNCKPGGKCPCKPCCKCNCDDLADGISHISVSSTFDHQDTATVGQTGSAWACANGKRISNSRINWVTSNPNVARVDGSGNITIVGRGSARIYACINGKKTLCSSFVITAVPADGSSGSGGGSLFAPDRWVIPAHDITTFENEIDLKKCYQSYPASAPKIAEFSICSSGSGDVASVDANGILTFFRYGEVRVSIRSTLNPQVYATICVQYAPRLRLLDAGKAEIQDHTSVYLGRNTHVTVRAADPNFRTIWTSDDDSIATVSDTGVIFGQKCGTTTLHVTATSNSRSWSTTQDIEVTVEDCVTFHQFVVGDTEDNGYPADVTKGLYVKYYATRLEHLRVIRAPRQRDSVAEWKASVPPRLGTNATVFGGRFDLPPIVIYDATNLQYNNRNKTRTKGDYPDSIQNTDPDDGDAPFGLLIFYKDQPVPEIYSAKDTLDDPNDISNIQLALGGGNLLADQSFPDHQSFNTAYRAVTKAGRAYANGNRPRTAIGYNPDTDQIILAVFYMPYESDDDDDDSNSVQVGPDGKLDETTYIAKSGKKKANADEEDEDESKKGASLYDVHTIMKDLGCNTVLNLDGGGSTRISYKENGNITCLYVYKNETLNVQANIIIDPAVATGESETPIFWSDTDAAA